MSKKSDWSELIAAIQRAGWRIRPGKHGMLAYPAAGGRAIRVGGTPSDHRTYRNTVLSLRRNGLVIQ